MKRLTLIRHANAEAGHGMPDFDRPLTRRGQIEAESLGQRLVEQALVPDLVLASPALRAQQTTDILVRTMGVPPRRVRAADPLYLARPETILSLAQSAGERVTHLAIVGHNPGLSAFARRLASPEAPFRELGTACACSLAFALEAWEELAPPPREVAFIEPQPRGV